MSEPTVQPMMRRSWGTLIVLILAVVGAIGYSLHERSVAKQSATQNAQLTAALQQTRSELATITDKINAINQPQQLPLSAENALKPTAVVKVRPQAVRVRKPAHRTDDPRWKKVQAQLDEQGKRIESTRGDLENAKTELSGSIARTHDELVVLQKRGERSYFEFDLSKSKQFSRTGPIGLKLRKANTKNQFADLQLMVDDVNLTKKHVNLYEPIMFYTTDGAQPAELVINSITKDHIRGYISEPKYRRSELAAMSQQQGAAAQTNAPEPPARKKLALPQ